MTVIAQLGTLITDAVQRGDDRATVTLRDALELIVSDASTDRTLKARRSKDAERQQRKRERESRDVTLRHVTQRDSPEVSPSALPFPNPLSQVDDNAARARADAEAVYDESVDNLIAMVTERVGANWPDVDEFLKRRPFQTWKGWLKLVLDTLTGGKALPGDVGQVCRDDAALERPVGSPKGFRTFVFNAVEERTRPPAGADGARAGKPSAMTAMTPGREHWADRKAREDREAADEGERKRVFAIVEGRKQRRDGEVWWARMERDVGTNNRLGIYRYAAQHAEEPEHV